MKWTKPSIKERLGSMALVVIGCVIMGLSYALFLIPHHFVPGGVSGLAIMINYFGHYPVGLLIIFLNIPVFFLGLKTMGRKYVLSSLGGMILSSVLIDFFTEVVHIHAASDNAILSAVYGGLMLGIGLGIVFRGHASTGGSDIVGMVISRYTGMTIGFGIMVIDFVIISASGLAFKSIEAPLYGYLVLYLSSKAIDMIMEGWNFSKLVFITSSRTKEISDFILNTLDRSGTALKSRSLYLGSDGELILTVVHRKQLADLRRFVKEVDPGAFLIITDTHAVLGKGFKSSLIT